ncbi:hypothetical protein RRG08_017407 [Elysia crispata]|uniref:Uncharacterized protein n=1 Tax=Elysia crispata TaxID=231223 RepID=A0AAE1DKL3_9GAST|nr:hypothetical protein RRG08_017407 [Elysia crispata]
MEKPQRLRQRSAIAGLYQRYQRCSPVSVTITSLVIITITISILISFLIALFSYVSHHNITCHHHDHHQHTNFLLDSAVLLSPSP